jgi:hypothetical protein
MNPCRSLGERLALILCSSLILPLLELLVTFLLSLPLKLLDHLRRTVLNQIALIAQARPLRQSIRNIHDALTVEHVAAI